MSSTPPIDLSAIPEDQRDAVLAVLRERDALRESNKRLEHLVAELNQVVHGKRSEKVNEDERQLASKFSDHLPLYRQSQNLARSGIDLHRSTLADWVGTAAFHLGPVVDPLAEHLKGSGKLFMDETTAPVLDPGRGRTKTGYLWALARDDRGWSGDDPPGVVFTYAPG